MLKVNYVDPGKKISNTVYVKAVTFLSGTCGFALYDGENNSPLYITPRYMTILDEGEEVDILKEGIHG